MSIAQIGFAIIIIVGFVILFIGIAWSIVSGDNKSRKEKTERERLKIIEKTFKDGHVEYLVEGKMYGYYEEVLKYQYAILTCNTLERAREELKKAKKEILAKELICKKEIYEKELKKKKSK